jgi:hypothetical protein
MRHSICLALGLFCLVCGSTLAQEKPPAAEPALRLELLERTEKDQKARNALTDWEKEHGTLNGKTVSLVNPKPEHMAVIKLFQTMQEVDEANTKWLKALVEKDGWPTISRVGKDGAEAAWLLVQHADADRAFQRKCLDLMTGLPKEEVSQRELAYLTDRVLLGEGKKQRYGTQFTQEGGKWQPLPLEDEADVDARRAEVGLEPLADYVKRLDEKYGVAPSK